MTTTKNPQLKVTITRADGTVVTTAPLDFDTELAALHGTLAEARAHRDRLSVKLHFTAGDKKTFHGNRRVWIMTETQVIALLERERRGHDVITAVSAVDSEIQDISVKIAAMDVIYRSAPWTRFFLCLSNGGHIHSSFRACCTLRYDTPMEWRPELSGKSAEQAVAELGPLLCSKCFPAAPVEWRRDRKDVERAARDADKAARGAARLVKNLADTEQFRDYSGFWVTTVAGAKQALRDEVELRNGRSNWHPESVTAAEQARKVLLARDADHGGMTEAEICTLIARAEKRNAR